MVRRDFIFKTTGLAAATWLVPGAVISRSKRDKLDRIAMSTVMFRSKFKQTKPASVETIQHELTLLDVPGYYKSRFGISNVELWAPHFESLEKDYLQQLRAKLKEAGSSLINIQADVNYDLATQDETERKRSLALVRDWIDAASFLGSKCIRINPGGAKGSVEKSIVSMKEVNEYAKSRKLILLTENHFGIEMNPDVHLRIIKEAGPENMYTLPDFGNYPKETMFESLKKIIPQAYMISAKADTFNENMEHVSYDFDKCVQMAESLGFKGIYSVEQWSGGEQNLDQEKVADWMIEHVKRNIK